MFVDLTPTVALVCAEQADRAGNLYTGANTEDTPTIVEAAAFRHGIVLAQVNEIVEELPRVDIPGSWVDLIVPADRPFALEPLFTRDPRHITELQVLMGMMVIRGIYERHAVTSLNHGIGFDTAADRVAAAHLRRESRAQRKDLPQLGAQSASDTDPRDRKRLGRERALLRWGGRHGGLRPRATRHFLRRPRRQPAFESRAVSARRPIRRGPVHRLDAADGCGRELLNGHAGATRRLRRSPEHGPRSAGAGATARRRGSASSRPTRRPSCAAASSSFSWSKPSKSGGTPTLRRIAGCDARSERRAACPSHR